MNIFNVLYRNEYNAAKYIIEFKDIIENSLKRRMSGCINDNITHLEYFIDYIKMFNYCLGDKQIVKEHNNIYISYYNCYRTHWYKIRYSYGNFELQNYPYEPYRTKTIGIYEKKIIVENKYTSCCCYTYDYENSKYAESNTTLDDIDKIYILYLCLIYICYKNPYIINLSCVSCEKKIIPIEDIKIPFCFLLFIKSFLINYRNNLEKEKNNHFIEITKFNEEQINKQKKYTELENRISSIKKEINIHENNLNNLLKEFKEAEILDEERVTIYNLSKNNLEKKKQTYDELLKEYSLLPKNFETKKINDDSYYDNIYNNIEKILKIVELSIIIHENKKNIIINKNNSNLNYSVIPNTSNLDNIPSAPCEIINNGPILFYPN